MVSTIRVLISLHNRLLRDSIARIFGKKTEFEVVAVATQPSIPITSTNENSGESADVMLLDSIERLTENASQPRAMFGSATPRRVLLAMEDDPAHFLRAVRRGAWGYVLQEASASDVVAAVRNVAEGQAVCPAQYTRILFEYIATQTEHMPSARMSARFGLTRREQQLIPLIERGLSNKEIANHLYLSEQTVKNHVHRILRKTGVSNRLSIGEMCGQPEVSAGAESSAQPKYVRVLS